jgi:hypothetical protein
MDIRNSKNFFPNQEQIKEKITRTLTDYIKELTKLLARHQLLKSNLTELQNKQGEARENERKIERSAQQQNDIEAELTKVNRQLQENIELSLMERDKLELEKNQLLQEQAKIKIDYEKLIKQYEIEIEQLKDEKRILDLRMEEQSRDLDRFYEQVRNLTQTNEKHLEEIEKLNDNIIKMTQSKNINEEIQLQLEGMISELQEKNKELDEKNRTISEITIQLNKLNSDNGQLNSNFKDFELFIDQELDRFRYNADELFYQFYDEEEQQSMRKLANELANEKRIQTANEATKGYTVAINNENSNKRFFSKNRLFKSNKLGQAQTQPARAEREEVQERQVLTREAERQAQEREREREREREKAERQAQRERETRTKRSSAPLIRQESAPLIRQEREALKGRSSAPLTIKEREQTRAERKEAQSQVNPFIDINDMMNKATDDVIKLSDRNSEGLELSNIPQSQLFRQSAAQTGNINFSPDLVQLLDSKRERKREAVLPEAQAQDTNSVTSSDNQLALRRSQPAARRSSRTSPGPGQVEEDQEARTKANKATKLQSLMRGKLVRNAFKKKEPTAQAPDDNIDSATFSATSDTDDAVLAVAAQEAEREAQAARRPSAPRSSVGPGLGQEEEEAVKQAARRSSASRSALENIALQNSTDKSEQGFGSALQVATRESPQAPRSVLQHLATQAARRSPQAARSSGAAEQASLSDETQSATSDTDVVAQEAAIAAKKIQRKVRKAFKKTQLPAQEEQTEKVVSDTSSISESEPALAQAEAEAQAQAQAQAARSSPPQQLKNEDSDITESEISPKSLTLTDDQQLLYNDLQKKINLTKKKFKNDTIIDQIIDLFDKLNDGNKLDSLNDIRKKATKKCTRGDEYCLIRDAAKELLENFKQ